MAWTGLALTVEGRNALNQAQIANRINFKSIVVGDGKAPANFRTLKELVHQLYEITDIKVDMTEEGCTVTADFPKVNYDYYFREIGIIVTTDEGDKLYVYDNCGEDAQYMVSSTGVETTKKRIRLALKISDVEEITVSAAEILYVAYDDYEETVEVLKQSLKEEKKRAEAAEETNKNNLAAHVGDKANPHKVTKAQVGLGNVDNTADIDKPVSTAQQEVLDRHTGNNTIHITSQERTNWNDANTKKHTHSNKSILDKITQALLDSWNAAYNHISDAVKHITAAERTLWNTVGNKVDTISGKGLSSNDYTTEEKNKLAGIAAGANKTIVDSAINPNSVNPVQNKVVKYALDEKANTNHSHNYAGSSSAGGAATSAEKCTGNSATATKATQDSMGQQINTTYIKGLAVSGKTITFTKGNGTTGTITTQDTTYSNMSGATASAAGKAGLVPVPAAGKQTSFLRGDGTWQVPTNTTYSTATQSANGLLSAADKKKLDGIATNANNYTHPTTAGNKHIPSGGSSGQILRWSSDGTAVWGNDNNTTYSNMTAATASTAGKAGLVPAPAAGKQGSFLRGDGIWATPVDTNTWRDITDSLTSTSTTTSLSAKAGKNLKDSIDTIETNLKQTTAGKFILPNGLKICWGNYTPPNANGYIRQGTITFPVSFSSIPHVFVTKVVDNSYLECRVTVGCSSQTKTSVSIKAMYDTEALRDTAIQINWFAIGY